MMTALHPQFIERIRLQFPQEWEIFIEAIDKVPNHSIHAKGDVLNEVRMMPVAHYANGFFLKSRPQYTIDPLFHLGHYYPQESSSMVIGSMVKQIADELHIKMALDLCASPGGKSILLHENLPNDVVIYSNEIHPKRNQVLQENLMKWGVKNSVVLQSDVTQIKGDERWDLILLDAPCSGEGLFRKDPNARKEWTPEQVVRCAGIQRELVQEAVRLLAPGGVLIYSTCTFSEAENQEVISWCIEEWGMTGYQPLDMPLEADEVVVNGVSSWRFLPHRSMGEGFFCCALQKPFEATSGKVKLANDSFWQPLHKRDWESVSAFVQDEYIEHYWQNGKGEVFYTTLKQNEVLPVAKMVQIGLHIGTLNKDIFSPHQGLILSSNASKKIPRFKVNDQEALEILRGTDWRIENQSLSGWHIVQWNNWDLAWVKMVKGRVSNHYPKEWRIRFL